MKKLARYGALWLVQILPLWGFEPYDYKRIPFPQNPPNPAAFTGMVETLTDIAMCDSFDQQSRALILAAARRLDPLHRRAFDTEYQLANGKKPEPEQEVTKQMIPRLLSPHFKTLNGQDAFEPYVEFLSKVLSGDLSSFEFEPPSNPNEETPQPNPGETVAQRCGFLSREGCIPLTCQSKPISEGAKFQFQPGNLESDYFISAYRESMKFLAISGADRLLGRRMIFHIERKLEDEGPAAALPCAVLTKAITENLRISPEVAYSGDVAADGTARPVFDQETRLLIASDEALYKVVVIPNGDRASVDDILILNGIGLFTKTQIFGVDSLSDAIAIGRVDPSTQLKEASDVFAQVQKVLNEPDGLKFVTNSHVKTRLQKVLELAPNHLSASQLQKAALGRFPPYLSLSASFAIVRAPLKPVMKVDEQSEELVIEEDGRLDPEAFKTLKKLQNSLDPDLKSLADAVVGFETGGRVGSNVTNERARLTQKLKEELSAISRNIKIREKMM